MRALLGLYLAFKILLNLINILKYVRSEVTPSHSFI